jgi:hypothetical protein
MTKIQSASGGQTFRTLIIDEFVKSQKINFLSFRRKPESSDFSTFWMPDQVRHDECGLFTRPSKLKFQTNPNHQNSKSQTF